MINKYLRSSSRLYFQEPVNGKNPISESDCQIISELSIFCSKNKSLMELKSILDQWKDNSDDQIYEALLELNNRIARQSDLDEIEQLDIELEGEDGGGIKGAINMIELDNAVILAVKGIIDIKKSERFNLKLSELEYLIIVNGENGDGTKAIGFSTVIIDYAFEGIRNEAYEDLKHRLKKAKVRFL